MKKIIVLVVVLVFACVAFAQETPKVEVFGGYQYLNMDFKGAIDRQNFNGWNADVAARINKNISIVGDISGAYKSLDTSSIVVPVGARPAVTLNPRVTVVPDVKLRAYNYLFGPRFSFGSSSKVSPFVEALFGVGHLTISAESGGVSAGVSNNGFAMAFGGGFDYNANKHLGIRVVKFDYLMNHVSVDMTDLGISGSENLNNFRFATGVVFKF